MRVSLYRHRRARAAAGAGKPHRGKAILGVFNGASVTMAADITAHNFAGGALSWDVENFDADAVHDNSSNTDRFTVPSAYNGKYGVLTAFVKCTNVANNSTHHFSFQKGGSIIFNGHGGTSGGAINVANSTWQSLHSGILPLVTGDIYTVTLFQSDSSTDLDHTTVAFDMEIVG